MAQNKRKLRHNNSIKREKIIPLIPNLFTTGNLFFGLLSIMTSLQIIGGYDISENVFRRYWWAAAFVVIAAFFDFFDGKLARLVKHETKFGLTYDSLSDLVSFGVAPGVLIYSWGLINTGKLGLMTSLFYIVCTALRLARFNVQSNNVEKYSFSGLPSPIAAGLMISPVLLFSELQMMPFTELIWFYLIASPIFGLLMVSNVKYVKFDRINFGVTFNALVISSIVIAAVITNPEIMLITLVYFYTLFGIIKYIFRYVFNNVRKQSEEVSQNVSNDV